MTAKPENCPFCDGEASMFRNRRRWDVGADHAAGCPMPLYCYDCRSVTEEYAVQNWNDACRRFRAWIQTAAKRQSGQVRVQMLEALMEAYRKHHMGDDRIGWEELSDTLRDAICEAMGDEAFVLWIKSMTEEQS